MPIQIEIKDQGIILEFPDSMSMGEIQEAIQKYPGIARPKKVMPGEDFEPTSAPMAAVDPRAQLSRMATIAQENPVTTGAMVGGLVPGPTSPITSGAGAMAGRLYQMSQEPRAQGTAPPDTVPLPLEGIPERVDTQGLMAAFGEGAGAELGAKGLMKAAGATLRPIVSEIPKYIEPSRRWIAQLLGLTPGGGMMVSHYRNQLNEYATKKLSEISRMGLDTVVTPTDAALQVVAPIQAGRKAMAEEARGLYREFGQSKDVFFEGAPGIPIPTAREAAVTLADSPYITVSDKQILDGIAKKDRLLSSEINQVLGGTGKKSERLGATAKTEWRKALYQDLEAYDTQRAAMDLPAVGALRIKADQLFKQMMEVYQGNETVKRLIQTAGSRGRPERAIDNMFLSNNADELLKLKPMLDDDTWNMAVARWLQNLVNTSLDRESQTMLYPRKWTNLWETYQRTIKRVAPEVYPELEKFTEMVTKAGDLIGPPGKPYSKLAAGAELLVQGSVLGGLWQQKGPETGVALAVGAPAILGWALLGPPGRQTIRRILASPIAGAAEKVGLMELGQSLPATPPPVPMMAQ